MAVKIDPKFRIDLKKDISCKVGGTRHRERQVLNSDGFLLGYSCIDCNHTSYIKVRRHRVKSSITL